MGLAIPAASMDNNRRRAPKFAASSEKPLGDWNVYEIYCRAGAIEDLKTEVALRRLQEQLKLNG